nr:MAG TPA: hypothetical protein [Bacteriophage sp.]
MPTSRSFITASSDLASRGYLDFHLRLVHSKMMSLEGRMP